MPVYDYFCTSCKKIFERRLTYDEYENIVVTCDYCGSVKIRRRINRIRTKKGPDGHLMDLAESTEMSGIEEDPKELGRMIRKLSRESDENLGPEFDEVVDRLEHGQKPAEIERSMPELPGGDDNEAS